MIFTYNYKPVIEDFGKNAKMTASAILKILENAGNAHSDSCGDDVFSISKDSRAWVLTEWQLEISEYPGYKDDIKVETWSEGMTSPLVCNRNFLMYRNGEQCLRGTTRWILLDLASGRPCRLTDQILEKYRPDAKKVFDSQKLSPVPVPECFTEEKAVTVQRRDIDFNDHVHNTVYFDYAMETLPQEIFSIRDFSRIRISYKTALKDNDKALCRFAKIGESSIVHILNESGNLCCIVEVKE